MADHRDGPRLVNNLLPLFQGLPARQQAIMTKMMGIPTNADTSGFRDEHDLDEEIEEARQHFAARLDSMT